jgi:hypothetical protein
MLRSMEYLPDRNLCSRIPCVTLLLGEEDGDDEDASGEQCGDEQGIWREACKARPSTIASQERNAHMHTRCLLTSTVPNLLIFEVGRLRRAQFSQGTSFTMLITRNPRTQPPRDH